MGFNVDPPKILPQELQSARSHCARHFAYLSDAEDERKPEQFEREAVPENELKIATTTFVRQSSLKKATELSKKVSLKKRRGRPGKKPSL